MAKTANPMAKMVNPMAKTVNPMAKTVKPMTETVKPIIKFPTAVYFMFFIFLWETVTHYYNQTKNICHLSRLI